MWILRRMSGPQLRAERRAAEVTVTALAARLNRPRQFIHDVERWATVDDVTVAAYRAAVNELRRTAA